MTHASPIDAGTLSRTARNGASTLPNGFARFSFSRRQTNSPRYPPRGGCRCSSVSGTPLSGSARRCRATTCSSSGDGARRTVQTLSPQANRGGRRRRDLASYELSRSSDYHAQCVCGRMASRPRVAARCSSTSAGPCTYRRCCLGSGISAAQRNRFNSTMSRRGWRRQSVRADERALHGARRTDPSGTPPRVRLAKDAQFVLAVKLRRRGRPKNQATRQPARNRSLASGHPQFQRRPPQKLFLL